MLSLYLYPRVVKFLSVIFFSVFLLGGSMTVQAQYPYGQPPPGGCDGYNPNDPYGLDCGTYSNLSPRDPRLIVARLINVSLSILGILAVAIVVFAGFQWMTAGGNSEQAGTARNILFAAVIGLVIILSAFSIANFVLFRLNEAVR